MLEQIKKYFESEYNDAKRVIEQKVWWAKPREVVNNCKQRMLGSVMLIQRIDETLSYEEIENLYNSYKEKLENLLTD